MLECGTLLVPAVDILGLLNREGGGELSIRRVEGRLLGVVYFYLKSNLHGLINDFDEGSDSVPGDGKRKKREREPATRFIWTLAGGERAELQPWLGREGGFLCSVQGWGADWRTLTSAQQEQLDSITLSTEGSYAASLHGMGLGGCGWRGRRMARGWTEPTSQPTNTTWSGSSMFAQGNWVYVPVLNEPLQRPQARPKAMWGKSLRPSVEV